jgi:hypothetical protein
MKGHERVGSQDIKMFKQSSLEGQRFEVFAKHFRKKGQGSDQVSSSTHVGKATEIYRRT